jgi:type I restriction-modification system DNA methylase subunit
VITAELVHRCAEARYDQVGPEELGSVYEEMLQDSAGDQRRSQGSYYTPGPVAAFMTKFAIDLGIGQLGPHPHEVLRILACDPSCGAGVFMVAAARVLAHAYASRLIGGNEPSGDLTLAVMPHVILCCVFGVDKDPVAVDLAKLALSLETADTLTPAMLDRHIICGNTLDGDEPPAMTDRLKAAENG